MQPSESKKESEKKVKNQNKNLLKSQLNKIVTKQKRFKELNPKTEIVPHIMFRLKDENKIRTKYFEYYCPTHDDRVDYISEIGNEIRNKYKKNIEEAVFIGEYIVHDDKPFDILGNVYRNDDNEIDFTASKIIYTDEKISFEDLSAPDDNFQDNLLIYLFEPILKIALVTSIATDDKELLFNPDCAKIIRISKKDLDNLNNQAA